MERLDPKSVGGVTRRTLLAGSGAIVVHFSLGHGALAQAAPAPAAEPPAAVEPPAAPEPPTLPGSLDSNRFLDAWLRIGDGGKVTLFTGKAELGQGIRTALLQVAAEELEVEPMTIELITADTGLTPNEGFTAGSQSMQNSGTAIRNAAAQIRDMLIAEAATRLGVDAATLHAENGAVLGADGVSTPYADLLAGLDLHVEAQPESRLKATADFRVMGRSLPRVDIPAKVTGGEAYVQDMRLPGMLHARVIRPPSNGATIATIETADVEAMPGVVQIVRDGNFLAVVAEREFQAVKAMRALNAATVWDERPNLPDIGDLYAFLKTLETEVGTVSESNAGPVTAAQTFEGRFTRPYQMHGSIGPSCAVGQIVDGVVTVWTHTQGVFPDRKAIAEMLGLPETGVRCIQVEGSGCYGHNGADDAAADAALLTRALGGRPVRIQHMREQEHSWEPYGPGMVTEVSASIDDTGRIVEWNYDLWSNNHGSRPGTAGALLPARHLATPFAPDEQTLSISPNGNGDRNATPLYTIPNTKILWHFLKEAPLRVSALRGLGAYANVFSIESTMDELALLAGVDPVEFRLNHMDDPRGRDVIERAAADFGWSNAPMPDGRGRGFAFARYKNHAAYLAIAVEVEIQRDTGRVRLVRAASAIDSGEIVNPDGIINQTEGGIIQSASWTLYEGVSFNDTRITSVDWSIYPILRFGAVPEEITVSVIDRPGQPFLGTGEAAQGPTGAAIGNAVRAILGKRIYDLPLTRERVRAAITG